MSSPTWPAARRLIPRAFGFDLHSLFLDWLTQTMFQGLVFDLSGMARAATPGVIGLVAPMSFVFSQKIADGFVGVEHRLLVVMRAVVDFDQHASSMCNRRSVRIVLGVHVERSRK